MFSYIYVLSVLFEVTMQINNIYHIKYIFEYACMLLVKSKADRNKSCHS